MPIDGLVILDSTGRPIIQSNFSSTALPLLHIDALNDALAKSPHAPVDPVIYVAGLNGPSACCHVAAGNLRFLCPVTGEVDPLFVFAFLQTFLDILEDYLGDISDASLKDNFDVVYQLLEEVLDDGYPLTTELNALRDIVLPPSILKKIISVAGIRGLSKTGGLHPFSSPIPWRKAGIKYNNNEIKLDLLEELDCVVSKNGAMVTSTVWGKILAKSKLSGVPDMLLTFANAHIVTDCSFHPCVRLPRWTRDKGLSFVPPDGRFTLMEYRLAPPASTFSNSQVNVPLPITLKPGVTVTEHGGSLDLSLSCRLANVQSVALEIFLGQGASAVNCMVSGGSSWNFDPKKLVLRWELTAPPPNSTHTLRGSFTSSAKHPRPARAFTATYSVLNHSYSGLKVDQLKLTGEQYKPYKGIRPRAGGTIEFRW